MPRHDAKYCRITTDPNLCMVRPCIRGLRMPVHSILRYLGSGLTIEDILREWPELEREDILEALAFAADHLADADEAA